ncbi:MFS transporter [Longimycelium tulufanense]|uniref:MFS transporter n=1 Tax=Longimycelium tulufanense TaxID=907463 RepID=A0A8J3CA95_9PSEU|nr:MFS transporter [Longimycelium tulufanense]
MAVECRPPARRVATVAGGLLLASGVVLAAANLRPAVTSLAVVLPEVQQVLGLSTDMTSVLTALPTLCFGLVAMIAPLAARRLGSRGAITLALALLTAGLLVRVLAGPTLLVAGTFVASSAIALCNVLIPVVVKESFPGRIGVVTGAYSASLAGGGALAASVTAPIDGALGGWRPAVGSWALLAAAALVAWWLGTRGHSRDGAGRRGRHEAPRSLLRSPLAWVVTGFFGLQALVAYTVMSWLPQILRETAGIDAATAGVLLAIVLVIGVPISFFAPPLAARARSQTGMVVALLLCGLVGFGGLLVAPTVAPGLWALLIGVAMGIFPVALTLLSLRTRTGADTAALSAMAQSFGYLIAAAGPFLVGVLRGNTGSWTASLLLIVGIYALQLVLGVLASRPRHV